MKILLFALERPAAELASRALRRITTDARLAWARSPEAALTWLTQNRDADAVIVDAATPSLVCHAFLEQVRALGRGISTAVLATQHLEAWSTAFKARLDTATDQERTRNELLQKQLKDIREWRQQAQERLSRLQADHDGALSRTNKICTALQERLLALEGALRGADERHAAQTAAAEQLARRETELSAALVEAAAVRTAIERRLADAEAAHRDAQRRAAEELAAAGERYTTLEDRFRREAGTRVSLEERLAAAAIAKADADRRHAAGIASLATRLADREAHHAATAVRITRICTALQERLLDLESAARAADERRAADAAAIDRLAAREQELGAALAGAVAARGTLEHRLSEAGTQHDRTSAQLTSAIERSAALESQLSELAAARSMLERRLDAIDEARQEADQRRVAEVAALAARLSDLQATHDVAMSQNATLERQLRDSGVTLEDTRRGWESEVTALAEHLTRREGEAGAALAEATAAGRALEERLAAVERAHDETSRAAAADLAASGAQSAALEERLGQQVAVRTTLEERLGASEAAHQDAARHNTTELASWATRLADLQAESEAATGRLLQQQAELGAALAEAIAARGEVEDDLAALEAEYRQKQERGAADLAAAAERHAALEELFDRESAVRTALEDQLSAAQSARQDADQTYAAELASLTERLTDLQGQFDSEVKERTGVEQLLADAMAALEQARRGWHADVAAAAEGLARRETELNAALSDAAAARAVVEGQLRDGELAHQHAHARSTADLAEAAERHAALQEQLKTASGDVARLQQEGAGLRRQLDAVRRRGAVLRRDAERVPILQAQIEAGEKENRRRFERAPYGLWECTRDGAIARVNHSMASLLGYRRDTDLLRIDIVGTAFECAADLRWLVEKTLRTGRVETVDTTLKTRDHRRLSVRLHALTSEGPILVAVEDLTRLSEIEQRLREAQRLEAVGRVASEVAVTCDSLLRDVSQGGRQWLAGFASDAPLRQQGEQLLGDVTRAAGFLRQFMAYGHRQISNFEPVSMQRLLRDLEPVLKRVLGDEIILTLPKTWDRFEVDVDSECVERILVNVANSARERMPKGGRVKIQLATTRVEQGFLERHSKVRPGAHVLVTITETPGATWQALPVPITRAAPGVLSRHMLDKPGMYPGPLAALIADLGGHLWMAAEPAGNMTVQIHLPKRVHAEMPEPAAVGWSNRGRQLARWFRH